MPSDDLRRRIEELNKRPLRNLPESSPQEPSDIKGLRCKPRKQESSLTAAPSVQQPVAPVSLASEVTTAPPRRAPSRSSVGPAINLEEAVDGIFTEAPAGPGYYLVEMLARELEAEAVHMHRRFVSLTGHPDGQAVQRLASLCSAERIVPERTVFLDIETTGLSMTPLFLIGAMECTPNGFLFRQHLARDFSEEVSVISAVSERLSETDLLVTFNGKSFDLPFIENRALASGLRLHNPKAHLDLLHEARRCWRRELPNCRLQTLEQMICGRVREEDIPSAEIPRAYHEFVRTGNANKIRLILQHNLYDLLTMADLMHRMWGRE